MTCHKLQDCTYCIKAALVYACSFSVVLMLYLFVPFDGSSHQVVCVHPDICSLKTPSLPLTDKSDIKYQAQ